MQQSCIPFALTQFSIFQGFQGISPHENLRIWNSKFKISRLKLEKKIQKIKLYILKIHVCVQYF